MADGNEFLDYVNAGKSAAPQAVSQPATTTPEKNDFLDYVHGQKEQPPIIEKKPEQHGNVIEGGLEALGGMGANVVQGYGDAFDTIDKAMLNMAPIKNPGHILGGGSPVNLGSEVFGNYGDAVEQGKQEHPKLAGAGRAIGETAANILPWEMGAQATGAALPFMQPSGPLGAALLTFAKKIPGALQNIAHMATTGTGGAFAAGMSEELANQMQKPGGKPNLMDIVKHGAETAVEAGPANVGLGILGEGVAKGLAKAKEIHLTHQAKMATKVHEAQFKEVQEHDAMVRKQLDEQLSGEAEKNAQAQKQAELDQRKQAATDKVTFAKEQAEHYRDQAAEELKQLRKDRDALRKKQAELDAAAKERGGKSLTPSEREAALRSHKEAVEESRKRAEYFQKLHDDGAKAATEELKNWDLEYGAAASRRAAEAADRTGIGAGRADHFQQLHAEGAADATGALAGMRAQKPQIDPNGDVIPPGKRPLSLQGGLTEGRHVGEPTIPRATNPSPADLTANDMAEQRALSFVKKNSGDAGAEIASPQPMPATPQPATTPKPLTLSGGVQKSEAIPPRAVERQEDAQIMHGLQKGRSNLTRSNEKLSGNELGLEGTHDISPVDIASLPKEEVEAMLKKIEGIGKTGDVDTALASAPPGAMQAIKLWRQLPESERTYDGFMHIIGVQKTSDIFAQYDPTLLEAMQKLGGTAPPEGGLRGQFNRTRGKLSFARLGAGEIDPETFQKGIRGKLSADEMSALPTETQRAINESRNAITEYKEAVKPVHDWLKEVIPEGANTNGGLARLKKTLDIQIDDLNGVQRGPSGNLEKGAAAVSNNTMKFMFTGKAANAVIHAAEKGVALTAREGIGVTKALVDVVKPGPIKTFVDKLSGGFTGPITEAYQEAGVQAKTAATKLLTGEFLEKSPNRVATAIGLGKAAKQLGYANSSKLAEDLVAAREGRGPLAQTPDKVVQAMDTIQTYVSDITGSNTAGFRDHNVFQRSTSMKGVNLFLTMPTVQARNFHTLIRDISTATDAKGAAIATGKLAAYCAMLEVAAGDKGAIPKEVEGPLRDIMGPAWYDMMDGVRAVKSATGLNKLPSVPHLQHSIVPTMGGGASLTDMMKTYVHDVANAKTPEKQAVAAAKAAGDLIGYTVGGVMGGGPLIQYAQAMRDGYNGFKMEKIYNHELLGESHVADVPVKTSIPEALWSVYSGTHSEHEQDIQYHAEKSHDMMNWVRGKVSHEQMQEFLQEEKELDSVLSIADLRKEKDEAIKDLRDTGALENDPRMAQIKQDFQKREAQDDTAGKSWEMRAHYWQERAREVQKEQKPKQPAGVQA